MTTGTIMPLAGELMFIVVDQVAGMWLNNTLVMLIQPNGQNFDVLMTQWFATEQDAFGFVRGFTDMWLEAGKVEEEAQIGPGLF